MSCGGCDKVKNIVDGFKNLAVQDIEREGLSDLIRVTTSKCRDYEKRLRTCMRCPKSTMLTKFQYIQFILTHIHKLKSLNIFEALEKIEELPRSEDGDKAFCRVCKCYIRAKCAAKDEVCPLRKW